MKQPLFCEDIRNSFPVCAVQDVFPRALGLTLFNAKTRYKLLAKPIRTLADNLESYSSLVGRFEDAFEALHDELISLGKALDVQATEHQLGNCPASKTCRALQLSDVQSSTKPRCLRGIMRASVKD